MYKVQLVACKLQSESSQENVLKCWMLLLLVLFIGFVAMYCEGCNCNFTLLRRKRGCSKCRRYFCSSCLRTTRKMLICYVCEIFMRRPILREDLKDIKNKDLIFYLQSEQISIAGCVEKDELISLVLQHVERIDAKCSSSSSSSNSPSSFAYKSKTLPDKPLEAIKQTCQNFFSSLGDNISQSWTTLENRSCAKSKPQRECYTNRPDGGMKTREIPTYTESQRHVSVESAHPANNNDHVNNIIESSQLYVNLPDINSNKYDFDCLEDELPAYMDADSSPSHSNLKNKQRFDSNEVVAKNSTPSQSSFQELEACGGEALTDGNMTIADGDSNSLNEWQILHLCENVHFDTTEVLTYDESNINLEKTLAYEEKPQPAQKCYLKTDNFKHKNRRRHSDSYLLLCDNDDLNKMKDEAANVANFKSFMQEQNPTSAAFANKDESKCLFCSKQNIKLQQKVQNMQNRLEDVQICETDIRQELRAFFNYLDKQLKYKDIGRPCGSNSGKRLAKPPANALSNDVNGIANVTELPAECIPCDIPTRLINLNEFKTAQQFELLTVKQLKELLMINRIDYKGCCEKHELLDRVVRLWKNLKSTPAVDKLATVELCKICMDAPIECVILECGHMATCTNCGKVLSECPICRQYIVRVVRFFRA